MAISPLSIPTRAVGEATYVAPDMNALVTKVNELISALNTGTTTGTTNQAPSVSLSLSTQSATVGSSVTATAIASDSDGTVTKVEFYDGTTLLGTDSVSPYAISFTPSTAGTHAITAKVTDNDGATKVSSVVNLAVTAAGVPDRGTANVVMWVGQSNDSGLSPRTGLPAMYYNTNTRVKTWDKVANALATYSLGSISGTTGYPVGATDNAITKELVPTYDNGFGPDVAFVQQWVAAHASDTQELFVFKKDMLHPYASTNGASIAAWLDGTNGFAPIYPGFLSEWQNFRSALTAAGYSAVSVTWICGIGEQDQADGNTNFKASLTRFVTQFRTDGILTAASKLYIAKKQRPNNQDATIAAAQVAFVADNNTVATLIELSAPTFLVDNTHYTQEAMLRLGALEYTYFTGSAVSEVVYAFRAGEGVAADGSAWTSSVGNLSFVQATAAKRASFGTGGATVTGGQVYASGTANLNGLAQLSLIIKGNLTKTGAYPTLLWQNPSIIGTLIMYWDTANNKLWFQYTTDTTPDPAGAPTDNAISYNVPFSGGAINLYAAVKPAGNSAPLDLIVNGVAGTRYADHIGTFKGFGNAPFFLFADSQTPTNPVTGTLNRLLLFNRQLTASEQSSYLA